MLRATLFQLALLFVVGLILDIYAKKFQINLSPAKLSSYLSYVMMTFTTVMYFSLTFEMWNQAVAATLAVWATFGFVQSFIGKPKKSYFIYMVKCVAGIVVVAPAIYMNFYMARLQVKNQELLVDLRKEESKDIERRKEVQEYVDTFATSPSNFEKIIRRGPLRVGDRFKYSAQFKRGSKVIDGEVIIWIKKISGGNIHVIVDSKFDKNKRERFEKVLSSFSLNESQSLLNKIQKPTHNVAFALITTAHLSLDPLPEYQRMDYQSYLKHIKTRRASSGGVSGYEVSGLPNLVYLSEDQAEKTTVAVSTLVGLPLAVKGKMPESNILYDIRLSKFKKGRY
ncbi:MAG: hypothetical protein R2827_12475 [Bdellovibrionales bacterium]